MRLLSGIRLVYFAVAVAVSFAAMVIGVRVGASDLDYGRILRIATAPLTGTMGDATVTEYTVVWKLRIPRVALAFVAGAALSVAGVLLQSMLNNTLVDTYTIGVAPAAAFGAAIVILISANSVIGSGVSWMVIASAILFAFLTAALVLGIAATKKMNAATLVLVGIALSQMFDAATSALQYRADEETLSKMVRWTFGSVNEATWLQVAVVTTLLVITLPVIVWRSTSLNAVAFAGDDAATSLGVGVAGLRATMIAIAVALSAVVISFTGVIGFVGLVAPHMARLIVGADHRVLVFMSALLGGILMTLADAVGRVVLAPAVVPVGIVVAIIGGPFFVYLILANRRSR
ncbi:FecCD family ABC transporter permease [Mycolicibacterium palauense]|uniref:FecCD family ABC transporter permease n=1 Tax=Mycolicibacterium palauense TaxID=2034511 RepID=UPI00159BA66E|nr:iron ABC transporter permease [Mycolicibacterium palauense]